MERKTASVTMLSLLLLSVFALAVNVQLAKTQPTTIVVPDNFRTIQDAVDAANSGDTIYVKPGIYLEHVTVDKQVSLIGENRTTTIIDGNKTGSVVYVSADDVVIKEFTVQNGSIGIYLFGSDNSMILQNNVIKNVNATNRAIYVRWSNNCTIDGNFVRNNTGSGILVSNSWNFTVSNNQAYDNGGYGINANTTADGLIAQNKAYRNGFDGIGIYDSNNVTVVGNTVNGNVPLGIWVEAAFENFIHHNSFINNGIQAGLANSTNNWDDGVEGNYWSDYTGIDNNYDGIGDNPHILDTNNTDNHPLMGTFSDFDTSFGFNVGVISNSTIEDFQFFRSSNTIKMRVSNKSAAQLFGFARVIISKGLVYPPYTVTIDNGLTQVRNFNGTIFDNGTCQWIYFYFDHQQSTHEVAIQGRPPPDTTPPSISILSPQNKTYPIKEVPLIFAVNESFSWAGYSLNGQANVTVSGNTTIPSLSEGLHSLIVYANDTAGNMGHSNAVYFRVDTAPPRIAVLSPENKTYTTDSPPLTFTVDETTSWIGYSIDGQKSITTTGNTTLSELSEGSHSVTVYANDTVGNTGASEKIYFSIEATQQNPFPTEIVTAAVVILAIAVITLLVYFWKFRETTVKGR